MMIKARESDRATVIDILAGAFDDNQSVNYIVLQDVKRKKRIAQLMSYSFDVCMLYGEVFLTEDGTGCALVLFPDRKKTGLQTTGLDLKLIFRSIGIGNAIRAMKREAAIQKRQPDAPLYYLWFIGVQPEAQGRGSGSRLLNELKQRAGELERVICLETSTAQNIPWYKKQGFRIYNELDLGYRLYFLKTESFIGASPIVQ